MGHSSRNNGRLSYRKDAIGYFFEMNWELRMRKAWHRCEEGVEESFCAPGTDDCERRPGSSLVFRKDHGIEEIGDEIGEVIGVVMGEENVGNPMPVHAGFE